MRHSKRGHAAEGTRFDHAAQRADGAAVGDHQHALRRRARHDVVERRRQARAEISERFGLRRRMAYRVGPEATERVAFVTVDIGHGHALPAAKVIFTQARVQLQRDGARLRQFGCEQGAALQRGRHDCVPYAIGSGGT